MENIEVTGSRIKRQDQEGVGPVTVFTAQDIEATGVISTETLLQRFSASAGFAGNQTNAYWADNGYGSGQHGRSVFYHNVQFSYRVTDAIDVAVGVDNLFDEDAPYVASWTDANTDTMTYDLLGQRAYLRATWNMQ